MPSISTNAIVLRHANFKDYDRMLTLFSPTLGRVDAVARGCRKQHSALGSATELFCVGEYQFYQNRDRYTLTGAAVRESYYPLRNDYDRLVYAMYILSVCDAVMLPEQAHETLFVQLLNVLARLSYGARLQSPEVLTTAFLLQLAEDQGYRPQLDICVQCGKPLPDNEIFRFDNQAGGMLCKQCGWASAEIVEPALLRHLREVQGEGCDADEEGIDREIVEAALRRMRSYMESRIGRSIKAARLLPAAVAIAQAEE